MIRALALALIASVALSSSVFAGGNGGTKKDATVKVVNNTNQRMESLRIPQPLSPPPWQPLRLRKISFVF